jgi:GntR family transcriptional regulator
MTMFDINPSAAAPIWLQIEEGMKRSISLGTLMPGDAVPSVRDLAKSLRVNPNTVARAYQRLTDTGIFTVKRGAGTYVSDDLPLQRKGEKSEKLRDAATQYVGTAIALGASPEEAVAEVETSYRKAVRDSRKAR